MGGGLGYALAFSAWDQWLVLGRLWLPLRGRLPWSVTAFLDDACQREVVRRTGAVYQFRHAQLPEHLADGFRKRHGGRPSVPADHPVVLLDAGF